MNIPATVKIPPFIQANPVFMLAAMFAHEQHETVGQKREASGEPYIVHPLEVSELVYTMGKLKSVVKVVMTTHPIWRFYVQIVMRCITT